MRSADVPIKTEGVRPDALTVTRLPTVASVAKTVGLPALGNVANTVRQRYADLSTVQTPPTKFLNIGTISITLIGHLIFGFFLGLAFLKAPRGAKRSEWPWTPILETAPAKRAIASVRKVSRLG